MTAEVQHQVLAQIQTVTELFAADGASDEQAAGRIAQSTCFFHNVLCGQFDKAHACKRLLSRGWPSDPYMHALAEGLVLSKGAIAQRIHYSGLFRERFRQAVAQMSQQLCGRIRDLSAAKHRFTSYALPFRRAALFFLPLLRVAQSILDERGPASPEGQDAQTWLESVDNESALQLALMADAADEVLILNRFFDKNKYDKAEVCGTLKEFLVRAKWLFDDWGAESTGCTAHMLKMLETTRTIVLHGRARTLGYPSDAVTWMHNVLLKIKVRNQDNQGKRAVLPPHAELVDPGAPMHPC